MPSRPSSDETILLREDAGWGGDADPQPPGPVQCPVRGDAGGAPGGTRRYQGGRGVRCVVLAASGKAFCAGHDLKQMRANPRQDYYEALFAQCSRVMQCIVDLPVPVIARVHGMATAAGCQLVASCDLAVAAESATFAVSGINVGLFFPRRRWRFPAMSRPSMPLTCW